jgi:hypothetical protein
MLVGMGNRNCIFKSVSAGIEKAFRSYAHTMVNGWYSESLSAVVGRPIAQSVISCCLAGIMHCWFASVASKAWNLDIFVPCTFS